MTEFLEQIRDPSSGVVTYHGVQSLPWSNHTFYTFEINLNNTITEFLYFCTERKQFRFAQVVGQPFFIGTKTGMIERHFTDDDFVGTQSCDQRREARFLSSEELILQENPFFGVY